MNEPLSLIGIGERLIVTLPHDLPDSEVTAMVESVTSRMISTGCSGVVIDVTAMDAIDSFVARHIELICSVLRLLGADSVVVGLRPAAAMTLVGFGLDLRHLAVAADVERGLAMLDAAARQRRARSVS